MINYYLPKNVVKSNPHYTLLGAGKACPFDIMKSYVEALPDTWRPTVARDLIDACKRKCKSSLQLLCAMLGNQVKEYTWSTSSTLVEYDRQVACLLKKYPWPGDVKITRTNGLKKFRDAEAQCAHANRKLQQECYTPSHVLTRARGLIVELLGTEVSVATLRYVADFLAVGPGSTVSNKGNKTTPYYKYASLPYTATTGALPYAKYAISSNPAWMELLRKHPFCRETVRDSLFIEASPLQQELMLLEKVIVIADAENVSFVPKDDLTDRPIGIGASLNMMIQLALKEYLTDQLLRVGINLRDQQRNRNMAYAGSLVPEDIRDVIQRDMAWSTIDLASASDTVSIGIVKRLLPREWYLLFSALRHESGIVTESSGPKRWSKTYVYHKFSAMGNGLTFPLESLIFWAVAKAACQLDSPLKEHHTVSVYGDDIIVRKAVAPAVIRGLTTAGFKVNTEKSFVSGPFKESCGADFFKGKPVRPFYLKREIITNEDVYHVANSVHGMALRRTAASGRFMSVRSYVISLIPFHKRKFIPLVAKVQDPSREGGAPTLERIDEDGIMTPMDDLRSMGINPYLPTSLLMTLTKKHPQWPSSSPAPSQMPDKKKPLLLDGFQPEVAYFDSTNKVNPYVSMNRLPHTVRSFAIPKQYKGMSTWRLWLALQDHSPESKQLSVSRVSRLWDRDDDVFATLILSLSGRVIRDPKHWNSEEDNVCREAASAGVITRRKSLYYGQRVVAVPNWNSNWSFRDRNLVA